MYYQYPLEALARGKRADSQLDFARQARAALEDSADLLARPVPTGLALFAANEDALEEPVRILRDIYGDFVELRSPRVRLIPGAPAQEPVMAVRVTSRACLLSIPHRVHTAEQATSYFGRRDIRYAKVFGQSIAGCKLQWRRCGHRVAIGGQCRRNRGNDHYLPGLDSERQYGHDAPTLLDGSELGVEQCVVSRPDSERLEYGYADRAGQCRHALECARFSIHHQRRVDRHLLH